MKVSIVVEFLMCSGSEFQTDGPKLRESTVAFLLALPEWDLEEAGVSTGTKRSRRSVLM